MDFAVQADHRVKLKENEKKYVWTFARESKKKLWNMRVVVIPIIIVALCTVTKGLEQGLGDLEIRGRVETILTIIEIGQNTEKSPGDLIRLAVTQTPEKNHPLTLIGKLEKK